MDEESHSTSQDSTNSREAVQMNNGVPLHNVNRREVYCVLCETIYSPGNEADRHLNICQDCEVRFELYNEETPQVNLEEFQLRVEEILQGLSESQWDLEERRQDFVGNWWDLEETRRDLAETRRNLEENWRNLEETQRGLEETRLRLEPHRQRVKQRLKSLPHVIITEEHEKKHNGLVCAICLDPLSVGSIVNELPCLHFFHPHCIVPWLKVRMSCPTCRYKISSAFHNETRQNSNRGMGFQEIVPEGYRVNSSSTTSNINELEVVVSESLNSSSTTPNINELEVVVSESLNSSSTTPNINELEVVVTESLNSSSTTSNINELEVVVSESLNSSSTTINEPEVVVSESLNRSSPTINEPEVVVSESLNSSSTTSNINELEVVVSESHNETTDSSVRDREGSKGGWFLFVAAPIVSLVGIVLVESLQNLLGDGRGRGSTGHVEFPRQCQRVRMFSSGSSYTKSSNSRKNSRTLNRRWLM